MILEAKPGCPKDVAELCEALLSARASLEAEFSGDHEQSAVFLRDLKAHLETTFGVTLSMTFWGDEL